MAKMFRKTGLPRVTVKDPNTKQWATRLSKTLDDLQTEQARQYTTYIDEQVTNNYDTVTNEYEEYVTNNYGIMLTGENGSIFYAWNGAIVELPHGIYGQVLVTGGHGQRPFWDWIWNAPGGMANTAFVIDCIVESSVTAVEKSMDNSSELAAAISSDFVSSEGPQSQLFETWDFSVTAADATQKVSMDHTSDQGSAAIGSEVFLSPYYIGVNDSIAVEDYSDVTVS